MVILELIRAQKETLDRVSAFVSLKATGYAA